jgi:hypothetical protein
MSSSYKKQSPVQTSIASTPATPKVTRRKRTSPSVQIPVATGDPLVATTETSATIPAASSLTTPALPSVVRAPPVVTIPAVPDDYAPLDMRAFMGHYPNKSQVAAVVAAITDLGNFVDASSVLGSSAPATSTVASAATVANKWRAVRTSTAAWDAYVKAQDAMAWKLAMALFDEMKSPFLLAVAKNPALTSTYPGLAAFFNATEVRAKMASTTKKKNAKAAAEAAAAATASAAAAAKAEATNAIPAKAGVTVNA